MPADVIVRFIGDASHLNAEVAKVQGMGAKLGTFAKGVGVALAAGFAIDFAGQAITSASDFNEQLDRTKRLFGELAPGIRAWAEKASGTLNLNKTEALSAANAFQTMFTQLGLTGDESAKMGKQLIKLAADTASATNAQGGSVAVTEAMQSAFRGEYDSLQRVIPTINAAAVEHAALAETGKNTAKELTQAEKAQATYNLVLQGGATYAGDLARTQGSAANQMRELQAKTQEVSIAVGQLLLPILQAILPPLQSIATFVSDNIVWFERFVDAMKIVIQVMFAGITATVMMVKHFDDLKAAVGAAASWIGDRANDIANFFAELPGKILSYLTGIPGRIRDQFGDMYDLGRQIISDFLHGITSRLGDVLDKVKDIGGKIAGALNPFGSPQTMAFYEGQKMMGDYVRGAASRSGATSLALRGIGAGMSTSMSAGVGSGGGATINVTVNVPATSSPADVGRAVVDYIRSYERVAGVSWRAS